MIYIVVIWSTAVLLFHRNKDLLKKKKNKHQKLHLLTTSFWTILSFKTFNSRINEMIIS